jgi:hypothetical protein
MGTTSRDPGARAWAGVRLLNAGIKKLGDLFRPLLPGVTATFMWILAAAASEFAGGFARGFGNQTWPDGFSSWITSGGAVVMGLGLLAVATLQLVLKTGPPRRIDVPLAVLGAIALMYFVLTTGKVVRSLAGFDVAEQTSEQVLIVAIVVGGSMHFAIASSPGAKHV